MSNSPKVGQYLTVLHEGREVSAEILDVGATNMVVKLPNGTRVTKPLAGAERASMTRETALKREKGS